MLEELDFRLLFEESPDVLLVLLPDAPRYTMVAATRARLEATMTTREQCIGKGLFEVFFDNPDDPSATGMSNLRASLDRVLELRAPDSMAVQRYDIRAPDGSFETRYWSPKNVPVLSPAGDVRYILHTVEDVTQLVRANELSEELRGRASAMERDVLARSAELATAVRELRTANAKLGELDAAKTAFFSNISHELRTPLTLMLAPLEDCLSDQAISAAERQRVRLAHDNALRLLRLVNALLDFSRLQAGRMRATFAPLDVGTATAELAGMFQSVAAKAKLVLTVDCPPLKELVWIDRDLWEKVVSNLVSNALKYTHSGEVAVRVREEPSQVVLTVSDTGIGISEADLPHVFERFYRVEGAVGRIHEGTGIGLSLAREIVELHGGMVSVASEAGRGSTFHVELPKGHAHLDPSQVSQEPLAPGSQRDLQTQTAEARRWTADGEEAGASAPAQSGNGPRARVLIVDDNTELRGYIEGLLAPSYDVSTAVDGQAALEAIRANLPDLVVSDVMMPRLDGIGLVRALRGEVATASLPVILLSARVGEESAIEGLDAGADDYVAKPFTARELLARVRTHVELARKRKAWAQELTRINRELDSFSSAVSHDLRTPAGQMKSFAELLRDDSKSQLSERASRFVEYIEVAAQQMLDRIEHLLRFARLSRKPLQRTNADLSTMATDIAASYRRTAPEQAIDLCIAPGLHCDCDEGLMYVVLENLISNAFKYSSKRALSVIEFGSETSPDEGTVFFVRDNGAGFDPAHASHLFTPFARMHTAEEFPGTGIGLATVHRIIERHGGRIWAKSAVGEGATFSFTIGQSPRAVQ
jgi:signal transduction histidine kinase